MILIFMKVKPILILRIKIDLKTYTQPVSYIINNQFKSISCGKTIIYFSHSKENFFFLFSYSI